MPSIITLQYTSHVTGKTNHDCSDSLVVTCVPPTQPLLFGTDIPLSMAFILSKGVVGELQPLACHLCYKFVLSLQAPPTALWTQCTGCVCKGSCLQLGSVPNIPRGHWASMTMQAHCSIHLTNPNVSTLCRHGFKWAIPILNPRRRKTWQQSRTNCLMQLGTDDV